MMTAPREIYDAVEYQLDFYSLDQFEHLLPEDNEDLDGDEILERAKEEAIEEMTDRIYCDLEAMVEDWIMDHECQFQDCLEEKFEAEIE